MNPKTDKDKKIEKILTGVVVSSKMQDTVVVEVNRHFKHPKYGKYINRSKKYKVHNPGNTVKEGEKVMIVETNPISKDKHFRILDNSKPKN